MHMELREVERRNKNLSPEIRTVLRKRRKSYNVLMIYGIRVIFVNIEQRIQFVGR